MTIKAISREEYVNNYVKSTEKLFTRHLITRECSSGFSWVVSVPSSSVYLAEIIILIGNSVLVHGDIPTVLFRFYDGIRAPERALRVVSRSHFDYLGEKAHMGIPDGKHKMVVEGVFKHDLLDIINDCDSYDASNIELYKKCLKMLEEEGYSCEDVIEYIYDETGDCEAGAWFGSVPDTSLIFARTAVRRLATLKGWWPIKEE